MSITVAASPRGARIGFSWSSFDGAQLLLTVAPKAWRRLEHPRVVSVRGEHPDGHYSIVLHETDRLQVQDAHRLERLIEKCARTASARPWSGDQWGEGLLHPDVASWNAEPDPASDDNADATVAILRLFDRVNLVRTQEDVLSATLDRSPLQRPILYKRLLDEVRSRMSSARRGYRPVTAVHTTIRGRASASTLARYSATGDPRIECRYSELTSSTMLLRIVCSALDWIADGSSLHDIGFTDEYSSTRLRHDAVGLRRALGDIPSVPLHVAMIEGPRLRLNNMDRPWSAAFAMSLTVLSEREHTAGANGDRSTETMEMSVRTDKLWERIVEQLMTRGGFENVCNQTTLDDRTVTDPWVGTAASTPRTFPDFVARFGDTLAVVDAKYKLRNACTAPGRDDQYQMFAYSHLVADGMSSVGRVILLYAGDAAPARWIRGRDVSAVLDACSVPFPQPSDVRDNRAWESYLDRNGELLAQHLRQLDESTA